MKRILLTLAVAILTMPLSAAVHAQTAQQKEAARIATRECWRRAGQLAQRQRRIGPLDDGVAAPGSEAADPATEAIAAERGAAVREAVAGLSDPYREVVSLRYFADLSPAAIAELLLDEPLQATGDGGFGTANFGGYAAVRVNGGTIAIAAK